MARRTVKVDLELGVAKYVGPAKVAERATESLDSALEDLGDVDGLAEVSAQAEKAGESIEDMGDSARKAVAHVDKLDAEIAKTRQDLVFLAEQFAETGDQARKMDITKAISATEAKLRNLGKSRNLLAALIPEPGQITKAGGGMGSRLGEAVTTNLQNVMKSPAGVAAVSAGVTLGAPLIGATLSAAVIGGVGIGGLVGGAILASRDQRIQQAGKSLGSTLLRGLESDATPMVKPLLGAIDLVESRFGRLRPALRRIFANSAEFVEPMVEDILDGVEGVVDGMDQVIAQAEPVMEALGDLFADTGESFGRAMAIMAGGSEDAASALQFLNAILQTTITSVGVTVRGLTEAWGAATWGPQQLRGALQALRGEGESVPRWVDPATASADDLGQNFYLMGLKAQGAHGPITGLTEQINEFSEAGRNAFDAATDWGAAVDEVTDAIKKNGQTLDANTEKGRANRQALSGLARAGIEAYNAEVKLSGAGERANDVARRSRAAFVNAAVAMGQSRGAAERLADQLGMIKPPPRINVNVNVAQALINANRIQAELNRIRSKTVRVHVQRTGEITYGSGGGRQAPQMAVGGPIVGPGPKGVDSVMIQAAPGEHMFTAKEVDAMGGHAAVMAFRRALTEKTSGAERRPGMVMRTGGGSGVVEHVHRVVLEARGGLAQAVVRDIRTDTGSTEALRKLLRVA